MTDDSAGCQANMRLISAGVLPIPPNIEHKFTNVKIILPWPGWDTGHMSGTGRMTPRQGVEAECQRLGKPAVVSGCIDLLEGREVDDALILALGGEPAQYVLTGHEGGKGGYWPRVWAARGLLHAWDDRATEAIIRATADDAWRVREMAAKVIARHRIGDALSAASRLRDDDVPRVRSAAGRAVAALTASRA